LTKPKVVNCAIYPDFIEHKAGIGNDTRMVIADFQEIGVVCNFVTLKINKVNKIFRLLRTLILGAKPLSDIDFVYAPHVLPRFYRVPHLVRVHDIFPITNPEWFRVTSRIFFKLSMKTQMQSFFLFDSITTKNEFIKYFGEIETKKYAVMYCKTRKLDAHNYCGECSGCGHMSKKKPTRFALAVGTIEPRKNYEFLVGSWANLKENQNEEIALIIVGSKGWKSRSIQHKMDSGVRGILWYESICDSSLNYLYSEATIFISASKSEGFNLPVKEALSFGTPIVLSDIAVHRELYGRDAFFFQLHSSDSFSEAVVSSLKYRNNSPHHFEEKESEEATSKEILKSAIQGIITG
jgi:glycosyltransferase involved in cell wall biosynthesis